MTVRTVAEGQEQGGMKRVRRGGRGRGGERGRDLQTNLITSLQNGITLLSLELLTSLKESEKEWDIEKREMVGREGMGGCCIKGLKKI